MYEVIVVLPPKTGFQVSLSNIPSLQAGKVIMPVFCRIRIRARPTLGAGYADDFQRHSHMDARKLVALNNSQLMLVEEIGLRDEMNSLATRVLQGVSILIPVEQRSA